jgi:hypothetical protein
MGGHSAWRKRVGNGELAKGYAGAICRHRPHLGRKGKDLIKNRKGWIGGGNPKKQTLRTPSTNRVDVNTKLAKHMYAGLPLIILSGLLVMLLYFRVIASIFKA